LSIEDIRLNVSLEFERQIATAEEKIRNLQRQLQFTGGSEGKRLNKELLETQNKVKKLYEDQAKSIDEQYKIQKGQEEAEKAKIEGIEEEESISTELTEAEKERLNIEKELIKIRLNGTDSLEQQVQKEIELVKQSRTLYDQHEKNLKLEELSNKLLDVKLQKRQKDINSLVDLSIQYEKADMFEKSRIRRLAELQQMEPEELANAFSGSIFDKKIIEEYWTSFDERAQLAIAKTTDLFKELSVRLPEIAIPAVTPTAIAGAAAITPTTNITNVGAQNINVNVDAGGMPTAEEVINLINKMIDEKLMTDESFINTFAKRISPKI
jgi:hypothetical protein